MKSEKQRKICLKKKRKIKVKQKKKKKIEWLQACFLGDVAVI